MPIAPGIVIAMLAFAANSVLCRMALGEAAMDAASFTALRLCSGAATLAFILLWRRATPGGKSDMHIDPLAALMLFSYAVCFSFAYLELSTAGGALILFGTVQLTMVIAGLIQGERPRTTGWLGMGIAFTGLIYLMLPGITSPSPAGALLMSLAGFSWGIYSLRGKRSSDPVAGTAWNFIATVPLALLTLLIFRTDMHISTPGIILGILSGALASALGYIVWYTVLPHLTPSRAATAQLSVPVLAAVGGVIVLDEILTPRLLIAGVTVLGGIGLAIMAKRNHPKTASGAIRP